MPKGGRHPAVAALKKATKAYRDAQKYARRGACSDAIEELQAGATFDGASNAYMKAAGYKGNGSIVDYDDHVDRTNAQIAVMRMCVRRPKSKYDPEDGPRSEYQPPAQPWKKFGLEGVGGKRRRKTRRKARR